MQRCTTILVNIGYIVFRLVGTLRSDFDDMTAISSYYGHHVDVIIFILLDLAAIVYFSLGIAGAISYNNGLLGVAGIAYFFSFCADLLVLRLGCVLHALSMYLHASLIMEIQNGNRGQRPGHRQQPQEQQRGGCYDMVSNEIPILPLI